MFHAEYPAKDITHKASAANRHIAANLFTLSHSQKFLQYARPF